MKIQPGDIVDRNGMKFRIGENGALIPVEELLAKRFENDDCEMTSGVRRAMDQHAFKS